MGAAELKLIRRSRLPPRLLLSADLQGLAPPTPWGRIVDTKSRPLLCSHRSKFLPLVGSLMKHERWSVWLVPSVLSVKSVVNPLRSLRSLRVKSALIARFCGNQSQGGSFSSCQGSERLTPPRSPPGL